MGIDHKKLRSVDGWLARTDFEIVKAILIGQQEMECAHDTITEIGVHHGKSFVALAAFSKSSPMYAIDLFGDQEKNIDFSGRGDLEIFLANLNDFGISRSRVVVDPRSSTEVLAEDIWDSVGRVRFFHIDGGHHFDAVESDLRLAVEVVSDTGVIAVDDVFRPEWPEVSMATLGSDALASRDFVCFAIGFNKSYFCQRSMVVPYQRVLRASEFLEHFLTRTYRPKSDSMLIYQQYPLPEWSARSLLLWMMSVYKPDAYVAVKPYDAKMRYLAQRVKNKGMGARKTWKRRQS